MHYLYTDKNNNFDCQVEIQGIDISKSQPRIVLETKGGDNFLFKGELNESGNCNVPLDTIKKFLKENDGGNIKLELVCENNIFTPWESEFLVKVDKKVVVTEVKSTIVETPKTITPKVSVTINEEKSKSISSNSIVNNHILELKKVQKRIKGDISKSQIFEVYKGKRLKNTNNIITNEIRKQFLTQ